MEKFYLLPTVTSPSMSIEERGALLSANLKELAQREGLERVHLMTHSFAGVDARAALSLFGLDCVRSLTTLCSPHRGARLVDNCQQYPNRFSLEEAEQALEAVGISQASALEFTLANMADFNMIAADVKGVEYFSAGAHKPRLQSSDLLRASHNAVVGTLTEGLGGVQSDGIVRPEESHWGRYLLTFPEHDHLEIVGFNAAQYAPQTVFTALVDNLRLTEIKEDPREAREYGVDHLFRSARQ